MIIDLFIFLCGVGILFVSGDFLVRSSIGFSIKMGVSPLIIGLTIVAFGTSAPELLVVVQAVWSGFEGLALGNIVGSNIANVLLVLGVPALIISIDYTDQGIRRNYIFMLVATLIFVLFLLTIGLTAIIGLLLILFLFVFLGSAIFFKNSHDYGLENNIFESEKINLSASQLIFFSFVGFFGLPIGAHMLIASATRFAEEIGISEELVGLTLVAIGTSLPELATSIIAAYRKEVKLILGNIIGSNMFNILGIGGIAALITPLNLGNELDTKSLVFLVISTLLILPFIFWKPSINRLVGISFIFLYFSYIIMLK